MEEEAHAQVRLLSTHFAPMQLQLGTIVVFNHYCFISNCLLMFPKAEAQTEKDEAEVQVSCPLRHGCACFRSLQPDWGPSQRPRILLVWSQKPVASTSPWGSGAAAADWCWMAKLNTCWTSGFSSWTFWTLCSRFLNFCHLFLFILWLKVLVHKIP